MTGFITVGISTWLFESPQAAEGEEILENYYHNFIADEPALRRPLAVEGKIQGRYDRLDYLELRLELIDYK